MISEKPKKNNRWTSQHVKVLYQRFLSPSWITWRRSRGTAPPRINLIDGHWAKKSWFSSCRMNSFLTIYLSTKLSLCQVTQSVSDTMLPRNTCYILVSSQLNRYPNWICLVRRVSRLDKLNSQALFRFLLADVNFTHPSQLSSSSLLC